MGERRTERFAWAAMSSNKLWVRTRQPMMGTMTDHLRENVLPTHCMYLAPREVKEGDTIGKEKWLLYRDTWERPEETSQNVPDSVCAGLPILFVHSFDFPQN